MEESTGGSQCHVCGSTEIETDYSKGESFCGICGALQEDELITNTIQYESGNSGHNTLVGRNVNLEVQGYLGPTGNPLKGGIARSSRDTTLSKNEDRLRGLGAQSKCGPDVCSHGFRIYKMAYDAGMTRKRPLDTLLCCCLYIASRRLKTGHMLSDFVHLLQGDIFDLAKTVRVLTVRLCISVPLLDPMMQVERFCHELVQDRALVPKLVNLGYRLVERMKKDWIDAGRKPAAVAAAAVIIACRVHNYEVELENVARIAQVSGVTIRRRLNEFAKTESAKFLPSQFESEDLPRAMYHPANFVTRKGKSSGSFDESEIDRKGHARCLKQLTNIALAASKRDDIGDEDMMDIKHSLLALTNTIEMVETRWKFTVEKSLFVATDLHYAIGDEEFEQGTNIVCLELLQSLVTNPAERQIRFLNLRRKYGPLLKKRADKKEEMQSEDVDRARQARAKRKAGKTTQGRILETNKPSEVLVSNRIDYERFNDYIKDQGVSNDDFPELE